MGSPPDGSDEDGTRNTTALRYALVRLGEDRLAWTLLALLAVLTLLDPGRIRAYPGLVDWDTIAALGALLVLTRGVERSGYLHPLARALLARAGTQRRLAVVLVLASALLATLLTNDVALFVLVPLTLTLRTSEGVPVARLIVFEALAVNAGSALTPIGNPQNLFLWQRSGASFPEFTRAMAPLVLLLLALLLLFTVAAFGDAPLTVSPAGEESVRSGPLLAVSLVLYLPFLFLAERGAPVLGLLLVLCVYLLAAREVLTRVDWGLLLLIVLMFVDLRLLGDQPLVQHLMAGPELAKPRTLFLAGVGSSQLISNVPAAILLAEYSHDWREIAWGVDVGGFGLAIGSLANIIALRLAGERRIWLTFHAVSVPFLILATLLAWAWLAWSGTG